MLGLWLPQRKKEKSDTFTSCLILPLFLYQDAPNCRKIELEDMIDMIAHAINLREREKKSNFDNSVADALKRGITCEKI